ncbi:MAG: hypothetical protein RL226_358 [Bacteroidota bacterium]|jgi:hypothetical protein
MFAACLAFQASAQLYQIPLERGMTEAIERSLSAKDTLIQTGFKPFHANQFDRNSVPRFRTDDRRYFNLPEVKWGKEHLIEVLDDDLTLYIDAILDVNLGRDVGDTSTWQDSVVIFNNTRGIAVYGDIEKKVSFHATVFENQTQLPLWLYEATDSLGVMPGQGRYKPFKSNARDYNFATGVISINATKWLDVHFGYGRHFIGHGYRSMLLSDVAANYPYLRLQAETNNHKLRFISIHAEMLRLERLPLGEVPESLFKKKAFSAHYLSFMPHPRLALALFESTVFERWNPTGTQNLPWQFFQPVPGINMASFGFDSVHKVVIGADAKVKLSNSIYAYGQFVVDGNQRQRTGFQAGISFTDLAAPRLNLRLEYNEGGIGLFSSNTPLQNYTHFNQALAHPLGTNFKEYIAILQHGYKRFWSEWRGVYQIHDSGEKGNVFNTSDAIDVQTASLGKTWLSDLRFGYLINPTSNFQAIIGWSWRDKETASGHLLSSLYYVQFSVTLFNKYYDF